MSDLENIKNMSFILTEKEHKNSELEPPSAMSLGIKKGFSRYPGSHLNNDETMIF